MKPLFHIALLTGLLVASPGQSFAEIMLSVIREPKQCPEGLVIKSKLREGMIIFDVDIDPGQIAHADELYRGRIKANAILNIATSEQQIAFVNLDGTTEGKTVRYQFRLSPSVAKTSDLQLGVHLFEKGGKPTLGGGHSLRIHLAGFEPKANEVSPQPTK